MSSWYKDPESQLIFLSLRGEKKFSNQLAVPQAHDEVCLLTGSRLATLQMTCCVHILQRSLQVTRELSWTSCIWPCGILMAWRRLIELWEYPNWSARYAQRAAGGATHSRGHGDFHFLLLTDSLLFRILVYL